jgi:hypothetical protein
LWNRRYPTWSAAAPGRVIMAVAPARVARFHDHEEFSAVRVEKSSGSWSRHWPWDGRAG